MYTTKLCRTMSRTLIILWIIIVTCNAFDIQCPPRGTCSCHPSHNGDIEIHCPTDNDSTFIVNVQPRDYIQVGSSDSLMLFKRESYEKDQLINKATVHVIIIAFTRKM
ncbi:hypothetical protein ANTPLA_LOCUS10750 [Anthophora plagiata]